MTVARNLSTFADNLSAGGSLVGVNEVTTVAATAAVNAAPSFAIVLS